MAINGIGSNSNTGSSSTADSAKSLSTNFSTFLTLLTTQLKNQDPLSPMDSNQFTQQLVQYSMVEQQINSNSKLDSLIQAEQANQIVGASGYIDRTVEVSGSDVILDSTKTAQIGVALPAEAVAGTVTIRDKDGNLVRQLTTPAGKTGRIELTWDGKDSNGNAMAQGAYKVSVAATDSNGKAVDATTSTIANVIGVKAVDGVASFEFADNITAPIVDLISVRKAGSTSTSTS